MTQQSIAEVETLRTIATIAVMLESGVYVLTSAPLHMWQAHRRPEQAARFIRSKALEVKNETAVRVFWNDQASVAPVLLDLNTVHPMEPAETVFWCNTTKLFFEPIRIERTADPRTVAAICPYCDALGHVGKHYDPRLAQSHMAILGGARA